jgi:hypothetical protein
MRMPMAIQCVEQATDQREKDHEQKAARHEDRARLGRRIAHQVLRECRQKIRATEHHESKCHHEYEADSEIASLQQSQIDHRTAVRHLPPDEEHEANRRGKAEGSDDRGRKPVVLLPAIEDDLQAAQGDSHEAESEPVDSSSGLRRVFAWCLDERSDQKHERSADRHIDQKYPTQVEVVRDPATECGANGGRNDDRDRVDGGGHSALLGGKRIVENRLPRGLQTPSRRALQRAECDQHRQAERETTQQRNDRERDDAAQK